MIPDTAIPVCACKRSMYQFAEGFFKCLHCDNTTCPYKNPAKCERCKNYEETMTTKIKLWYVKA